MLAGQLMDQGSTRSARTLRDRHEMESLVGKRRNHRSRAQVNQAWSDYVT